MGRQSTHQTWEEDYDVGKYPQGNMVEIRPERILYGVIISIEKKVFIKRMLHMCTDPLFSL